MASPGDACDVCGRTCPPGGRVCPACGAPILGGVRPRLERKLISAVFVDVVGSTALAEREDPEVVRSVVGRAFDAASRQVVRHGGFVEKFIGDAILAVFGIPTVREDDAERAVLAALDARDAIDDANRRAAEVGRPEIAVRIGVESGEVLVDLDRVEGAGHRMLTGDAVNTAARLQQSAEPGQVVVGPATYAATRDRIRYLALPGLSLKGKRASTDRWEPTGPASRAPVRVRARMVGRDPQLEAVLAAYEDVRRTRRPALVVITGSPGIGKSRLVVEFVRVLESPEPACVLQGRCVSYGDVPYSAFAEAMRQRFGIGRNESPDEVTRKTAAALEELLGDRALVPHLTALFGAEAPEVQGRQELFDGWRRIVERTAERAPVVLVLEDLHWADDGLLDLVEHLTRWGTGPVLVLALGRPELLERRPAWGRDAPPCRTIRLGPLSPEDVAVMLGDLLGGPPPPDLLRTVTDRSEGNPLFGEEVVRMMVDLGALRPASAGRWEVVGEVADGTVPPSIQSLVASRIDSLTPDEKAVAQDAAVIGRSFHPGTVAHLADVDAHRLRRALRGLETKELIVRRSAQETPGEPEFSFHHALIREVAYGSMPKALRADKHLAVALGIATEAGERAEEIAALLATHHLEALRLLDELGETDERRSEAGRGGLRWARIAAERSARLWQQQEAARWFRIALDLAPGLAVDPEEQALLWERSARAADGVAPYDEVVEAFEQARSRYERLADLRAVGRVEASMANAAIWAGRFDTAGRHARLAVERLRPLGESAEYALALFALGRHALELDDLDAAEPALREAMEVAERTGERSVQANAAISLGWTLQARHDGSQTVRLLDEALRLARETGDLVLLLDALEAVFSASIEIDGHYGRAMALLDESIELAERSGNLVKASRGHLNRAYLLRELGRLGEAAEAVERSSAAARAVDDPLLIAYGTMVGALTSASRGRLDEAVEAVGTARSILAAAGIDRLMYWDEFEALIGAWVATGRHDPRRAAEGLATAVRTLSDERLSVWMGQLVLFEAVRALTLSDRRGEAEAARGRLAGLAADAVPPRAFLAWADGLLERDPSTAREHLIDAAGRLEALGRRLDLGRCLVDLADAERRMGRADEDTRKRGQAILVGCGAFTFLETGTSPRYQRGSAASSATSPVHSVPNP